LHPITGKPKTDKYPTFGGPPLDLKRFALTDHGVEVAKNIMCIVAKALPQIECAPLLANIIPLLLHHLSPDNTLGAVYVMVRHTAERKKWFFFPITSSDTFVLYNAFSEVASRHTRALTHLKQFSGWTELCAKWIDSCLLDMVTLPVAFRMLDSFFVEGYKILIRYGVGALTIRELDILQCTKFEYITSMYSLHPIGITPDEVESVAKAAHSFSFSRQEVEKIRNLSREMPSIMTSDFRMSDDEILSPFIDIPSLFLHESHWDSVWAFIPRSLTAMKIDLRFSTEKHGYRLSTLYQRIAECSPVLLFVETTDKHIMGAFLSDPVKQSQNFTGSGETFLFQLTPTPMQYKWDHKTAASAPDSRLFVLAQPDLLVVGGGGNFFGLSIDEELKHGTTGPCNTFKNFPLCHPNDTNNTLFNIRHVEVWIFKK
jgi:TBC1 domain family member 24